MKTSVLLSAFFLILTVVLSACNDSGNKGVRVKNSDEAVPNAVTDTNQGNQNLTPSNRP